MVYLQEPAIDFATAEHENIYSYKVNKNHTDGFFKDRFISVVLEDNPRKRKHKIEQIIILVAKGKHQCGLTVPNHENPLRESQITTIIAS